MLRSIFVCLINFVIIHSLYSHSVLFRWLHIIVLRRREELLIHRDEWQDSTDLKLLVPPTCNYLKKHVFTAHTGLECVFSFGTEEHHCMPETMDHRLMRRRKLFEIPVRFSSSYVTINLLLSGNFHVCVRV